MDAHLKLLAEAGLALGEAEEAIDESAFDAARESVERAEEHLAALRAAWPGMTSTERRIVGAAAKPVADRAAAAVRRIPRRSAFSQGTPEVDPDEDVEPGAAPIVTDRRADGGAP